MGQIEENHLQFYTVPEHDFRSVVMFCRQLDFTGATQIIMYSLACIPSGAVVMAVYFNDILLQVIIRVALMILTLICISIC